MGSEKSKSKKDLLFLLKGFFDILIEYNEGVKDGTINRVDEFLRFYGEGDTKKGLQYIKDDLLNVDMASHYLSETYEWGIVGFGAETIVDILLKYLAAFSTTEEKRERILKNTNANRSFEESEIKKKIEQAEDSTKDVKSITDEMESFIRYLEEGMSK